MKGKSDKVLTNNHFQMSQASNQSFFTNSKSCSQSDERTSNFDSNPFESGILHNDLKKVRITGIIEMEKEKSQFVNKVTIDLQSSQNKAIDALEQFKCTVRSRQAFTSPLGGPKTSAPKIFNTELSQILSQQATLKPQRKNNKRKAKSPTVSSNENTRSSMYEEKKEMEEEKLKSIEENEEQCDADEKVPEWALKENARDAQGNFPGDPNYNPRTLYIPPKALESFTPLIRQFWEIKSQHFDEILLFKVGDFYRIYYEDAVICHKELGLNWLGNRMVVGIHRKCFDRDAETLINNGHKVCVVEQKENQKLKNARVRNSKEKEEKTIKREIAQVMSKGTFIDYNNPNYEPKYLLSIRTCKAQVAVVFLEIGYSIITFGTFQDDENYTTLKTLISQIKPTEIIYDKSNLEHSIIKILKANPNKPILSPLSYEKTFNSIHLNEELETYYGDLEKWPEGLTYVLQMETAEKDLVLQGFIYLISYLKQALILEQILHTARYEIYDPEKFKQSKMILDSQALHNLEILEVSYATRNPFEGSLLSYLDKTSTKYGARLLKQWVCSPLLSIEAINERLDAIEDLDRNWEVRDKIRFELKKLPDFEKLCGKIYSLSIKKPDSVILFEDVSIQRLQEFRTILDSFENARTILSETIYYQWNSSLLKRLFTLEDHKAIMNNESSSIPDISPILQELSSFIIWEGANKDVPTPKPGIDKDYDKVRDEINHIGHEFERYLEEIKSRFNDNSSICYTHVKHRYEIEIPVELVGGNKKPTDFDISSKKKGYERFVTQKIRDLVAKLEDAEGRLQDLLKLFVCFVFRYFYTYHKVWDCFIKGLAQLDCLCSLSIVSFTTDEEMCRPEVFPLGERNFLDIRSMRHPCLSVLKQGFVPNDIMIGDIEGNGNNKNVILLTGPNMGGKSTILRQACIAAIIAQIGCYVPASSCKLSVVDRIFTRIGASDRLIEGKSTFSIEMEETLNILRYGTNNSLAIMDELGRGTTTFDGLAIAYSVLKYITEKLMCRAFFATHYHILLDEFKNNSHIGFYFMNYQIDNRNERIRFLYRLTEENVVEALDLIYLGLQDFLQRLLIKQRRRPMSLKLSVI